MAATVWRGRIAFGMVSIPVRLHKAARRERIRFHHVFRAAQSPTAEALPEIEDPEPEEQSAKIHELPAPVPPEGTPETVARIRNLPVADLTETRVEKPAILKGYEIEPNRYVTFEPREVAAIRPRTSTELGIVEFVRTSEIDPMFFETSYYVAPDPGGEKPYALLYAALSETGYAAVGSLAMHGREHAVFIRPGPKGLVLHTLFYANEVRSDEEYTADSNLVSPKELDLAKLLVGALKAKFDPANLKDAFEERLREFIQKRADTATAAYEQRDTTRRAPVVDIMEALRKSLEMVRKPPKREEAAKSSKTTRAQTKRARRSR